MTRTRAVTIETMLRKAAEQRVEQLQTERDVALDALACLVAAFPELGRAHSTATQQAALRAAVVLLAEHGRQSW